MATTYHTDIQKLYVAYFNRPADFAGLNYWETVVETAKGNTAGVAAAFAASAEYQAEYGNLSNEAVVARVYQNLFGHAPDAPGQKYWADLLTAKKFTVDEVVTQIAAGALTTDLTAYNNKVAAATAFTNALDLPAEQTGYTTAAANVAAKTFIAGITTDASLTAAMTPAALNASVALVVAAGTAFSVATGLATLNAATEAKADFLAAADGDDDADTSTSDVAITAAVATAIAAVDVKVAGDYAAASSGVQAALLADQVSTNASVLAAAQKALGVAQVKVAEVAGLTQAAANLTAAKAAVTASTKVQTQADAALAASLASYGVLSAAKPAGAYDAATGTFANVIVLDADTNKLVLATGVTEAKNPGVTALLAASSAKEVADANVSTATKIEASAQATLNFADLTDAGVAALAVVAGGMTIVTLAADTMPTLVQMNTEQATLNALKASAAAVAAKQGATQAEIDASTAATAAADGFKAKVDAFLAADNANPLIAAQTAAEATAKTAAAAITDLAKLVSAVTTAKATVAEMNSLNDAVDAATDAFADHDLVAPVTLTAGGAVVASAGADIFVSNHVDATIFNFGLQGKDVLFVGSDYTLNTGKFATAGNNGVLEMFLVQSGADTLIKMETTTFSSNSADAEVTITLTGVNVADVHLANGIITVG